MIKPLDSGLRRNDEEARIKAIKVVGLRLSFRRHASESSPAWMQVVEPCLEQAAEESTPAWMQVVERRLEQAAEEGVDGVPRETLIQSEFPEFLPGSTALFAVPAQKTCFRRYD